MPVTCMSPVLQAMCSMLLFMIATAGTALHGTTGLNLGSNQLLFISAPSGKSCLLAYLAYPDEFSQ